MRKFNLFNFLEKKLDTAEIDMLTAKFIERASFRDMALHIAISYIANTLSKCEIKTYDKGIEVRNKLYYALNVSPNSNENSSQFINHFIENYYYNGSALIVEQNGMLYCADGFDVDETNPLNDFTYTNVTIGSKQLKKHFKAKDVFYMKLDNENVRALFDSLYADYGEIISLAIQSFKRTNGKKYKLLLENYKAGDPNFNQIFEKVIKQQLKTFIDNDNSVYPQFKGLDLQEFSTATPIDSSDITAMRKEIFEVTAQAFKIPMSMMLGNITNMNEIVKVYLSICIDPLADMISEELTRKYYSFEEWKEGCYIKVDTSCINHVDMFEVADKVDKLVSSGVCCIDEIRPHINLEKLDTEFSTSHFITKNYAVAEEALSANENTNDRDELV